MTDSSTGTFPTQSDGTYGVGNVKVEEDMDMKVVGEVNVKTVKGIGSEEEECIDIKGEVGKCSEEEQEEPKYIDTKEEEEVNIEEEVS
jgi:hypothetical protein